MARKTHQQYRAEAFARDPALRRIYDEMLAEERERLAMMADEPPAPLSDAELVVVAHLASLAAEARGDAKFDEGAPILLMDAWRNVRRLLSTLAARDVEIERLKSQVTIHETWRQDAEFRLISEHEHHMREYAEDSATLAAYREIVAAVAGYDATYCGIEIGHECALNAQQRARTGGQDFGCHWNKFEDDRTRHMFVHGENCPVTRARALLAGMQTPATAQAGEDGEA